jgi:hypothetical protein
MKLALAVCVSKGGKGVKRGGRGGLKINNLPVKPKVAMILRRRGGRKGDVTTTDNKQQQQRWRQQQQHQKFNHNNQTVHGRESQNRKRLVLN